MQNSRPALPEPPTAEDQEGLHSMMTRIRQIRAARPVGRICRIGAGLVHAEGLTPRAQIGDQVTLFGSAGQRLGGEVIRMSKSETVVLPAGALDGIGIGDEALLFGQLTIAPCTGWIGRIIDANGQALDGAPLPRGAVQRPIHSAPPNPAQRRGLGPRLESGMRVFNTLLPIVQAQRIGLFAGSGVGKSTLIAHFAAKMQADVVVIALIGERGREVLDFVQKTLGPEGMARTIVVAATSDEAPLMRRRSALTAMTVAEHFRDAGKQVLLLADSITRFAEAHREIAVASGEPAALRGYPASTAHTIMSLCERAGPGPEGAGDITALFSVLVAGSNMDEPIADIMRGVLDGHVVMDRAIAERGRYPAIDAVRSVSRSLPEAASAPENALIASTRQLLGSYDASALMIRAGLYSEGSDPLLDTAVRVFPELDAFIGQAEPLDAKTSFQRLEMILRKAGALQPQGQTGG